jgi:heme-degrading monooxygenase HmoA
MIARLWHGAVPREKGAAYLQFLQRVALPDYRATPGNRGVHLLRREEGDASHFVLISYWESLESIRGFAGDDPDRARYYPEDSGFLLEMEPRVMHYEVMASSDRIAE